MEEVTKQQKAEVATKKLEVLQTNDKKANPEDTQIEAAIAQIIDNNLPSDQKKQQLIQIYQESFSGPLPHPQILKGYQEIIHNAPERILTMAEKQLQHRIDAENTILKQNGENINNSKNANMLSQASAVILILCLIIAGTYLTKNGDTTVGGIIFGTTIVSVAGVFITGKLSSKNNSNQSNKGSK